VSFVFSALIKSDENVDIVEGVFNLEDKSMKDRASYEVVKKDGIIEFHVSAKDSVAFRAILNSVCKLLVVVDKVGGIE